MSKDVYVLLEHYINQLTAHLLPKDKTKNRPDFVSYPIQLARVVLCLDIWQQPDFTDLRLVVGNMSSDVSYQHVFLLHLVSEKNGQ